MHTATLNLFNDCQVFQTFNGFSNKDTKNISVVMEIAQIVNDEKLNLILEELMKLIPKAKKEVENTKYSKDECIKIYNEALTLKEGLDVIIDYLNSHEIDDLSVGRFLSNLNTIYKFDLYMIEAFDEYIEVLEAREENKEEFLTLDEALCV